MNDGYPTSGADMYYIFRHERYTGPRGVWGGTQEVKVFYSDQFVLPLPEGHRFPMKKYSMLRERVEQEDICEPGELRVPHVATDVEILRAHNPSYLRKVTTGALTQKETRRIGFPWSEMMVARSRRASGGTLDACRAALEEGLAANLAGGTHHAFADHGEGFCVLNDSAIAAHTLREEGLAERDRLVFASCRERDIPVAVTMAGGYAREVSDAVDIHFQTIQTAATLLRSEAHQKEHLT